MLGVNTLIRPVRDDRAACWRSPASWPRRRSHPRSAGTFPVTTPLFVVLLVSVDPDRQRTHLLSGALARADRRAPADGCGEALLTMTTTPTLPSASPAGARPTARDAAQQQHASRKRPLFDPPIVRRAIRDAFIKLHPRHMVRNPVMFVVLIGSVLHDARALRDVAVRASRNGASPSRSRSGSGSPFCSRTSRRRWPRGAARRRRIRCASRARRRRPSGCSRRATAHSITRGMRMSAPRRCGEATSCSACPATSFQATAK